MKQITLYFILVCYAGLQLKPFFIGVQDTIAHRFFITEHLQKVHSHHGGKHVHTELKNTHEENSTPQNQGKKTNSNNNEEPAKISELFSFNDVERNFLKILFSRELLSAPVLGYSQIESPPPRLV